MFQFYCSKEKIKDRRDETPIMDDTSCAGALKAFTPLEEENRRKRDFLIEM